jgi:hypothetical protein
MPAGSLRLEHLSRAEHERRERRRAIDVTSERWKERRRRNKGGLQAFSPRISKSRPVFCKDFQRKLWRFFGISRGYMGPNREKHPFQIFHDFRLLSTAFTAFSRPLSSTRATRVRGRSAVRRHRLRAGVKCLRSRPRSIRIERISLKSTIAQISFSRKINRCRAMSQFEIPSSNRSSV